MNNLDSFRKPTESLGPKNIHFRCPNCSKLFAAKAESIHVEEPEFKCTSCSTHFSFSFIKALSLPEIVGLEINKSSASEELPLFKAALQESSILGEVAPQEEAHPKPESIPFPSSLGVAEVQSTNGYSFEDLDQDIKNKEKEEAWERVLACYDDRQAHRDYVAWAKKHNLLDEAAFRYHEILKYNPHDKIAQSFSNIIDMELEQALFKEEKGKSLVVPAYSLFLILLGICFLAVGYFVKDFQSLMGLGLGIILFTLAVRALFK